MGLVVSYLSSAGLEEKRTGIRYVGLNRTYGTQVLNLPRT